MPIKFEIKLQLQLNLKDFKNNTKKFPLITPDHLHGFFFSLIPSELAEEFHKPSRFKPFCIWTKDIFKFYFSQSEETQEHLTELILTISLLRDEHFPQILAEVFENREKLFLGPYKVKLAPLDKLIRNDQYLNFKDLLHIKPKSYFHFYFITPVTFKKGEVDYPLPDPKLIFKSLLNKWNYFSPVKVGIDLRKTLEDKVCIIFAGIRTHKIKLSLGGAVTGFTGKVIFYGKNLTEDELLWLNILGHFSNFSGVGRKTTMGLGMTKFEALEEEVGK